MTDANETVLEISTMLKNNTIEIEGGCHYDFERHVVIHNDGPFTDQRCVHSKTENENELADRVREQYCGEIENAKVQQREPPVCTFVSEEKVLSDFRNFVVDCVNDNSIHFEIRKFEWNKPSGCVLPITCLPIESYDKQFNCCLRKLSLELSENLLVRIPPVADAFDAIYIPCVDAKVDIKSVTLLAETKLPKYKEESLGSDYVFSQSRSRSVLVEIKKLTNIVSNRICFAEQPIVLNPQIVYYIKIEYNDNSSLSRCCIPHMLFVEVEELYFVGQFRDKIFQNISNLLDKEPRYATTVYLK